MQMCILCCTNDFFECIFSFIFRCEYASLYEVVSVCLSIHQSVHPSIPCYFLKKKIVDFDDDKSSNDKINNATIIDDEVVTSYEPPPWFSFLPCLSWVTKIIFAKTHEGESSLGGKKIKRPFFTWICASPSYGSDFFSQKRRSFSMKLSSFL